MVYTIYRRRNQEARVVNQQEQNAEYTEALLALHKLYVEMANAVSQRRDSTNRFLLTLATTPVALLVLASRGNQDIFSNPLAMVASGLVGLAVSCAWVLNLTMYRKLNRAKFIVIEEIEADLPHAGFTKEWQLLKADRYQGLTKTETMLPALAGLFYAGLILYAVYVWCAPAV